MRTRALLLAGVISIALLAPAGGRTQIPKVDKAAQYPRATPKVKRSRMPRYKKPKYKQPRARYGKPRKQKRKIREI